MFSGGDFADVVMVSARVHGIAVFWVFALSHHDRRSTLQPMGFRSPNPSEIPLPDIVLMIIKSVVADVNALNAIMGCLFLRCPLPSVPEAQSVHVPPIKSESAFSYITQLHLPHLQRHWPRTAGGKNESSRYTVYYTKA